MNIQRIWAITLRHLLSTFRSLDKITTLIYWPVVNIVMWGLTGLAFSQHSQDKLLMSYLVIAISMWQIAVRINIETSNNVMQELMSQNLINLFASPLKLSEWIVASMIMGIFNTFIVISACAFFISFFYSINIFLLGWLIVPLSGALLLSGWAFGFFMSGLFIYYGFRIHELAYIILPSLTPFAALYAPLSILPSWVGIVAKAIPFSYIFETIRSSIVHGTIKTDYVVISIVLSAAYFVLSLLFFYAMFARRKKIGLTNLS